MGKATTKGRGKTAGRGRAPARPRARAGTRTPARARWGWRVVRWGLTGAVWGLIGLIALIGYAAWDLPEIADLSAAQERRAQIHALAADGTPIAATGDQYGRALDLEAMSPLLIQAVIAVEDRRFYDHFGLDPFGIARAAMVNLLAGGVRQGGSTLTQQLAKTLFLTPERTVMRKLREALLALWMEATFSKDQILEIYLNRVYLGAGVFGADAAARRYFGVGAEALDLTQAALIAGLPRAPSRYNPVTDPEAAADRASVVLSAMVAAGYLSAPEADAARRDRIEATAPRATGSNGRWFADWAIARASGYLGGPAGDAVIRTTLDPAWQRVLEREAASMAPAMDAAGAGQLAAVLLAPDGAVLAMLGGRSWAKSPFNRAVQGRRQPGSAFKPIVWLAGLKAGLAPDDRFRDEPITIDGWTPRNAAGDFRGAMTLREGAARSSNSIAVAVLEHAGREETIALARRLGIAARLEPTPALALGVYEVSPLELAGAYAAFANGGLAVRPHAIARIEGPDGSTLYAKPRADATRAAGPEAIAALNDLMRAVVAWGTGRAASLPGRAVMGKTGTTQDYRDAWFAGSLDGLTLVIWMGNDDGAPMDGVGGGGLPAALWARVMGRGG